MITFGGLAATRSYRSERICGKRKAPWRAGAQRRGAAPGSRASGPMPQRPSERRASGKIRAEGLLDALLAGETATANADVNFPATS